MLVLAPVLSGTTHRTDAARRGLHDEQSPSEQSSLNSKYAVPYLQYIYIRPQNRRQDMSEVLHAFVLAVAGADAAIMDTEDGAQTLPPSTGVSNAMPMDRASNLTSTPLSNPGRVAMRTVPFTLFETEPPDHGDDHASRAYALERSKIHASSGGVALVLRRQKKQSLPAPSHEAHPEQADARASDEILSAHVQPGLEPADPPLTLVWMIRPSPTFPLSKDYNLTTLGPSLIAAYYQSLRDEGFPEKNIRLAERIVRERCRDSVFEVMPLAEVRDFQMESLEGLLDVDGEG